MATLGGLAPTTLAFVVLVALPCLVRAPDIPASLESQVKSRLAESAKESWELGTRAQTLLELDVPSYSVFSNTHLPPSQNIDSSLNSNFTPIFSIAQQVVSGLGSSNNQSRPEALVKNDGSAADPASIGPTVLLANWTRQAGGNYSSAARNQLQYLLTSVPKTPDGAISHRVANTQLWSDFIYMVPPFLAYYGAVTKNQTLLSEAYNQIMLYRKYLRDTNANNLWKHIVGDSAVADGPNPDSGYWATGNGWAAAGMVRVLATIQNSDFSDDMSNERNDLAAWTKEIHAAMYSKIDKGNVFQNYVNSDSDQFNDAASTALMASSVYRLSLIAGIHTYLPSAERSRTTLGQTNKDGSFKHFDSNGWLTPVVNPHSFGQEGSQSPEGQAFVLMMQQSWREWVQDGSQGASDALSVKAGWMGTLLAVGLGMTLATV